MDLNLTGIATYQMPSSSILTSDQLTLIIILSLVACLSCIYAVFFFGRRLQTSSMLRSTLVESVKQQELLKLLNELDNRAENGPLDATNNPPPKGCSYKAFWHPDVYALQKNEFSTNNEYIEWGNREKAIYGLMKEQAEEKASRIAEDAIPKSIDISLLGGGFNFLLEFSTVIVLIFVLLILGIIGAIDGREISTILAAIAGYVLGKASSA